MKSQQHDLKAEWAGIIKLHLEKIVCCWKFEGNLSCKNEACAVPVLSACFKMYPLCFLVSKHRYSPFMLSNADFIMIYCNVWSWIVTFQNKDKKLLILKNIFLFSFVMRSRGGSWKKFIKLICRAKQKCWLNKIII